MELVDNVSGAGLVAVYSVLLDLNRVAVEDCCTDIGIGIEQLEQTVDQYREFPLPCDASHLQMARWFVVRVGPRTGASPAEFEAAVVEALESVGAADRLVFPCWLLASPIEGALQGRLPARPLGDFDKILDRAHDGLLGHVAQRATLATLRHKEMALSSTIWRIVSLIEYIVSGQAPGNDLHHQIAWLQSRLNHLPVLSSAEQVLSRTLDNDLSKWRNALTHVSGNHPWTFVAAAECSEAREPDIWETAAAVNLGVIDHIAEYERTRPPPRGIFSAIENSLSWF